MEHRLRDLLRQIHAHEPNDPKYLMLRAIFDHECQELFTAVCADLKAIGVTRIKVNQGKRLHIVPFQPQSKLFPVLLKHFGSMDNAFPVRLPPRYWGDHFLS